MFFLRYKKELLHDVNSRMLLFLLIYKNYNIFHFQINEESEESKWKLIKFHGLRI